MVSNLNMIVAMLKIELMISFTRKKQNKNEGRFYEEKIALEQNYSGATWSAKVSQLLLKIHDVASC